MMENVYQQVIAVSVVMPAYNAEKTIGQAIQSVLNQTHKEFELIIVDDCSKDSTLSIIRDFQYRDSRIRVLKNNVNLGVSDSRNNGVEVARFNWVAFLDSDDMWETTKLERQIAAIPQHPQSSIFFTGSAFMNADGQRLQYTLKIPTQITYKDLLKQNLISCSSTLVRRESLTRYPMDRDPMIHEDYATWLKILKEESYAVGINEPLLIYRLSPSSKSGNKLRAAKDAVAYLSVYRFALVEISSIFRHLCIQKLEKVYSYLSKKRV